MVVATSAILLLQTTARKNTLIALQVALFTIIFNAFLKSIWQIPLPETAHSDGWAYPSGHTHFTVAYWSIVCLYYRSLTLFTATGLILTAYGYALVAKGYHHSVDILPAAILGISEAIVFVYLFTKSKSSHYVSALLTILSVIFLSLTPLNYTELWLSLGAQFVFPYLFLCLPSNTSKGIEALMQSICIFILMFSFGAAIHIHSFDHSPLMLTTASMFIIIFGFYWPLKTSKSPPPANL